MSGKTRHGSDLDHFASESRAGMALPLLPTLVVAALVGAMALCHEPAAPGPETRAAAIDAAQRAVGGEPQAKVDVANPLPASLAFTQQFPMNPEIWVVPSAAAQVALRTETSRPAATRSLRAAAARHVCPGPRCGEAASARADEVHVVAATDASPHPSRNSSATEDSPFPDLPDLALPDLTLPFAPTVRAATRFVGEQAVAMRSEAVTLRDSVVELVGLR